MENKKRFRPVDLTYIALFVAMMAIGANITDWVPFLVFGTVPITLQTFFAVLAGAVLGQRLGIWSMLVYMLVGLAGAPVFAKMGGGIATAISPTFGFIVSFIFTAWATAFILDKAKSTKVATYVSATLVGVAVNYLIGTTWLYFVLKFYMNSDVTYLGVWKGMLVFIPKDAILAIVAAYFAIRLRSVLSKTTSIYSQNKTA